LGCPVAGEAASMPAANEGKILVVVDVAELAHKPAPARSPRSPRRLRPESRRCRRNWLRSSLQRLVTVRILSGSASVLTGSWRSYCGRRRTRWRPRKWRPDSTANWRPCGRGRGDFGWWAEAALVAHRRNELRDEEFASGSQATRANNGAGWVGILSDLTNGGKRKL
jgi:hypothetical protein